MISFYFIFIVSVCFKVVQLLLSSNMCAAMLEPKPSDPNGVSPLHLAAKNGHIDVIRSVKECALSVCLSQVCLYSQSFSYSNLFMMMIHVVFCPVRVIGLEILF